MNKIQKQKTHFFIYLEAEKNFSKHTCRAYQSDLEQLFSFWNQANIKDTTALSFNVAIERFLVSLFYKKIDKSTIARKISCFKTFEKFLNMQDFKINLKYRYKLRRHVSIPLAFEPAQQFS